MGLLEIIAEAKKKKSSDDEGADEAPESSEDMTGSAMDEYLGDAFDAKDDKAAFVSAMSKAIKACKE